MGAFVDDRVFVSFYEIFGLDPDSTPGAIERRFRQLVRRYHPDNMATGDRAMFDAVLEANETLKDPDRRAQYHERHEHRFPPRPPSFPDDHADHAEAHPDELDDDGPVQDDLLSEIGIARDLSIQNNILALLYHRRRRFIMEPGIGNAELERMTGCPHEHLEFHLWYLKAKGWVATAESGLLVITVSGVDRAAAIYRESANRLLTDLTS